PHPRRAMRTRGAPDTAPPDWGATHRNLRRPAMTDVIRPSMMDTDMGIHLPNFVIGLTAFLTVVDLFATQAILPTLVRTYHVAPSAMGVAVNASTFGMAASGLLVALFS